MGGKEGGRQVGEMKANSMAASTSASAAGRNAKRAVVCTTKNNWQHQYQRSSPTPARATHVHGRRRCRVVHARAQAAAAAPMESDSAVLPAAPPKDVLLMKLGTTSTKAISSKSKPERIAVSELLPLVEKENPTVAPASSALLEGSWQFRYCGTPAPGPVKSPTREFALLLYAGGYSPGLFGFEIANKLPSSLIDIGDVSIDIVGQQPRATVKAEVSVLGRKETITITED